MIATEYEDLVQFVQGHFTDGLVLIVGSGLSAAEGISGMGALASHLIGAASGITGDDQKIWSQVESVLKAGEGLEAALLKHPPSPTLETWILNQTCELLLPEEHAVIAKALRGEIQLRLTTFLAKILRPPDGLPIITTNYDRLVEVACELAGFHVDTTATGHYAGDFDPGRSCMAACRGIKSVAKTTKLDFFPRAVVLKPHGSFDWYRTSDGARRCTLNLDGERLIITPGFNKYRAGYNIPFDKHRELANNHINAAARLLVIGYGFNDDHLQNHLLNRIRGGTPTLIVTHTASDAVQKLAEESPQCMCLSKLNGGAGVLVRSKSASFEHPGADLWDIGNLAKELLG